MALLVLALLLPLALAQERAEPAPQFTIDLDLPPRERHQEVARHFKSDFPNLIKHFEETHLQKKMSLEERKMWLDNSNIKEEFQEEIRGFTEAVGSPTVKFEQVLLFNLMYELAIPSFCSGVIAADGTGRVYHGRNLDNYMKYKSGRATRHITDISVNLTYVRGGQPLFNAHSVAGYVGLHTVLKMSGSHRWSFQQNGHHLNDRALNLKAMQSGALPFGFYMRELIEQDVDFKTAVRSMVSTRFGAPSFFMMAGDGSWEGAALEIKRNSSDVASNLARVQVLAPQIARWFLIQTNEGAWEPPQDDRRPIALQMLRDIGGPPQMNEEVLMRIMRTRPLFNDNTAVSVVSVPAMSYVQSLMRKEEFMDMNLPYPKNMKFHVLLH